MITKYRLSISDEHLVSALDACSALNATERRLVTHAMAEFVAKGALPKSTRDGCVALARHHDLIKGAFKPQKKRGSYQDGCDAYTAQPGPVDARAVAQIGKIPVPPGRRTA